MKQNIIDLSAERNLVTGLIVSPDFAQQIIPVLEISYLQTPFTKLVAGWAVDFWNQYKSVPGKNILEVYQNNSTKIKNEDLLELTEDFLTGLSKEYEKSDGFNVQFCLNESLKYLRRQQYENLNSKIENAIDRGDCDEANKLVMDFQDFNSKLPERLVNEEKLAELFKEGKTLNDHLKEEFQPINFIVEDLIPQGSTLLVGDPKIGKSWLILQLALSIAYGLPVFNKLAVTPVRILFLALEDTARRINVRIKEMLPIISSVQQKAGLAKKRVPQNVIEFFHSSSWGIGEAGLKQIRLYHQLHPDLKIIFIDTLQAFRGRPNTDGNAYAIDHHEVSKFSQLCQELNVSIFLVHHTNKGDSEDWMHGVSGTQGIAGACDTIALLKRERRKNEATLSIAGRDLEEKEIVLEFSPADKVWNLLGNADVLRFSKERQAVLEAVQDGAVSTSQIAKRIGKSDPNTSYLLKKLVEDGILIKKGYGKYGIKTE